MLQSSEATHSDDGFEHSQYYPPSIPDLDDGKGEELEELKIEVQVMGYEFTKAVLTSIRMNEVADDSAALEYSISRDTDKLASKSPSITSTVEDRTQPIQ